MTIAQSSAFSSTLASRKVSSLAHTTRPPVLVPPWREAAFGFFGSGGSSSAWSTLSAAVAALWVPSKHICSKKSRIYIEIEANASTNRGPRQRQ